MIMKMCCLVFVPFFVTTPLICCGQTGPKSSVNVVSKMATAATKGDYIAGIAIGENYLRENPKDTTVLEQTAILSLAQAKQDQNNRKPLIARAILLLERAVKDSDSQIEALDWFTSRFIAARGFESAGDLSSDKCLYYRRGLSLNSEAATVLNEEYFKLDDDKEISTMPLKAQSIKLKAELEDRVSKLGCSK